MTPIKTFLKDKLGGARKVAVLGIGSKLRSDDAAGVVVAEELRAYFKTKKTAPANRRLKVFIGETAPENLTGQIKKFRPTHVIIIDALELNLRAGSVRAVDISREAGVSCSTHRLPIGILADYFFKTIACNTILLGIQPQTLEFGQGLSKEVRAAVRSLSLELKVALKSR